MKNRFLNSVAWCLTGWRWLIIYLTTLIAMIVVNAAFHVGVWSFFIGMAQGFSMMWLNEWAKGRQEIWAEARQLRIKHGLSVDPKVWP